MQHSFPSGPHRTGNAAAPCGEAPASAGESIACDLYDQVEVLCLFRYEVVVTPRNGADIRGMATDTLVRAGRESLLIDTADGQRQIELATIAAIRVETPGARIQTLRFD